MFKDRMDSFATPERVYVLCKIVESGIYSSSEIREKMEPAILNGDSQIYFPGYRAAAEELGLLSNSDQMLSLAVESRHIANITAMRKYVNTRLSGFSGSQFYRVTQAYFNLNNTIMTGEKNLANLGPQMSSLINMHVDAMDMRAWRFWVTFLGFGYLENMFFIPNAKVFLEDVLQYLNLKKGIVYSFGEFINLISPYAQIILGPDLSNHHLNYGFSNGLRTLHDMGYLKLEHVLDSSDIWNLYPFKAHPINSTVTNITIL